MIEEIEQVTLFWKAKLEKIGRSAAILFLTKDDEKVISLEAKYLPIFMKVFQFFRVYIVSDSKQRLELFMDKVNIPVWTEIVPKDNIIRVEKLEHAFGVFNRIYSDASVPMEDGDFYNLIGYDNVTIEDIVCRVIYQLRSVPTEEEIDEARTWAKETYRDEVLNIRNITRQYEHDVNEGLIRRQKSIVEKKTTLYDKNIFLYADTKLAELFIKEYSEYNIKGIIDRDVTKTGRLKKGVPIYNLTKLEEIDFKKDVIFITNRRCEGIVRRLNAMGGEVERDYFVLNPKPDIVDWDNDKLLKYVQVQIEEGEKIYSQLRDAYPNQKLLLNSWKSSGDIYLAGLYLTDYIKYNCPNGYKIVVSSPLAKKVAALMEYDAELISIQDMRALLVFLRTVGFEETNSMNLNVHFRRLYGVQRSENINYRVDLNTFHQRTVFDSKIKRTKCHLEQKNSDIIFEKNNLRKEKTILISPYSYTVERVPKEYFEAVVKKLVEMGYDLCTNVAADEEALEGTKGLFIPYEMVIDFVNKAGGFIGVRSGLCDIISSTSAKMFVVNEGYLRKHFSLIAMGLKKDNIMEVNDDDFSWKEIVEKTINFFGMTD